MAQTEAHQRKQFTVPGRDELVQQIKQLDEEIEHVTLNLIKCDFNATQKDVEKAFPEINFVKVKNYNPGSFEVVFQMKIDAINFIRNYYDKKILSRRFFIKMGRQQKQLVEEWTGVGFVPKTFTKPFNKGQNQNKKQGYNKNKKTQSQTEQKQQTKQEKATEQVTKPVEETQPQQKKQQTKTEQKKQGKHIPKGDYQKKPYNNNREKKPYNKDENKKTEQKTEQPATNAQQTKKQAPKKQEAPKKQAQKQQAQKPVETKPEPKEEDDGWIVVSKKTTGKRK